MLKKIPIDGLFNDNHGWLNTFHHFSFNRYYNPERMGFGKVRVINNDYIAPKTGFETHPHKNMEIITYVIGGKLTHKDSMGNIGTIGRGEVQYMSAGTGVYHSEHNLHDETLHLYQIWILPEENGLKPNYGESHFKWEERVDKLFHMVSSPKGNAPIKIYSDVNIYSTYTDKEFEFQVKKGRQLYLVVMEGAVEVSDITLNEAESLESVEEIIYIKPKTKSHLILFEMEKGE
ncbi:MAG: pirin family protein [Fusobacteriaceae bacterium]|nr:pirin family protein [Fusobacteriaceae bacterium]MBN2838756.1 pirin family protein [Fusobacteriaceae bacterium]